MGGRRRAGSRPSAGAPGRSSSMRNRNTPKRTTGRASRSEPIRAATPGLGRRGRARRVPRARRRARRPGPAERARAGGGRRRASRRRLGSAPPARRASARRSLGRPGARVAAGVRRVVVGASVSASASSGSSSPVVVRGRLVVVGASPRSLRQLVGGAVAGRPGPWRYASEDDQPTTIKPSDTSCAVGIPKNVQLSRAQQLEDEPDEPVPDEEDQQQVARAAAVACAGRARAA